MKLWAASAAAAGLVAAPGWRTEALLPVPRTEVAAAVAGREILVAGGYVGDGSTSARVDLFDPATGSWRRGPDLPQPLNHAASATLEGRAVVAGGYGPGGATAGAVALYGGEWRPLPGQPARRAAAGAVALNGRLYVVGGVSAPGQLAVTMHVYVPDRGRWLTLPGPTPREHLAVTAAGGRIYALGGRTAGYDTNLALVESWAPGERRWRREASLPKARGGTGAAVLGGRLVSIGGEEPAGTIASVYALDLRRHRWERLPDLPSPRHGLGVVAFGDAVYAIGGGLEPGLAVSSITEALRL